MTGRCCARRWFCWCNFVLHVIVLDTTYFVFLVLSFLSSLTFHGVICFCFCFCCKDGGGEGGGHFLVAVEKISKQEK